MPEFQLDTNDDCEEWCALDDFTQGYIEALFFTEQEALCETSRDTRVMPNVAVDTTTMQSRFVGGNPFGFADLDSASLAAIIEVCRLFQVRNGYSLRKATRTPGYDSKQAGRDFWFTRNGHGVGFWDRDLGKTGEELSAACRNKEVHVYVGDDGKVYVE